MINVIIFGTSEQSSVTWHYMSHSNQFNVVGFTVDKRYRTNNELYGLPIVDFENVQDIFSPSNHQMIIPIGWTGMNRIRAEKVVEAIKKGYKMASYVDEKATIYKNFIVKSNTIIQPGVIISPFAEVGINCTVRTGSIISHHVHIGDHCFIATGVTISGNAIIGERSVLGVGCVIRDSVHIAPGCFIGAGAVVIADTQPNGVYLGIPAKLQTTPADQLKEVSSTQ
jgi:sugar O-acyltransferase (sialic acid O-acetyltransferase NeuD family)